jgi:hypothetical protein
MKNFILTGIVLLALAFSSCGDRYVTEENYIAPEVYTRDFRININHWQKAEDMTGIYYYAEYEEPKLTDEILNYAILQAFYCYTLDNEDRYALLPYEDYWANLYTEYFTVEFSRGMITFLYKNNANVYAPERQYDFRVRFLW